MMQTRRFRPSQASYWSNCAAFQRFTENVQEDEPGDAAREGTCAAWVAQVVLTGDATTCEDMVGKTHPNGWMVTEQMALDIQEYVDLITSIGGQITVEETVTASQNPLIEGTLDNSITSFDGGILQIIDLKYGHKIIETTAAQLVCYAYGKLMTLPQGSVHEIRLSIYQPRGFHHMGIFRTRKITPEQLHQEFLELWNMANEACKPDSLATPGPHCSDCAVATKCEALAHSGYKLADFVTSRHQRDMTPEELSRELDFISSVRKTIEARFKAVESEAEARAKREAIPNYQLKPKLGNRTFAHSPVTVQLLTGVDPWEKSICTPAELVRRGASKEAVEPLTKRVVTSHKLTRITSDDIASMFEMKGK